MKFTHETIVLRDFDRFEELQLMDVDDDKKVEKNFTNNFDTMNYDDDQSEKFKKKHIYFTRNLFKDKLLRSEDIKSNQREIAKVLDKINLKQNIENKNTKKSNYTLSQIFGSKIQSHRLSSTKIDKFYFHSRRPSVSIAKTNHRDYDFSTLKSHRNDKENQNKKGKTISGHTSASSKPLRSLFSNLSSKITNQNSEANEYDKEILNNEQLKLLKKFKISTPPKILNTHFTLSNPHQFNMTMNTINTHNSPKGKTQSMDSTVEFFKTLPRTAAVHKKVLSDRDKEDIHKIFRKGIKEEDLNKFTHKDEKKPYSIFNSKNQVKNVLFNRAPSIDLTSMMEQEFKSITKFAVRNKKKNIEAMAKEISLKCNQNFQLVHPVQFSKHFQLCNDLPSDKNAENDKLNQMTGKKFGLRKEINNIIKYQKHEEKKEKRKDMAHKWKRCIITAAIHFKKLNMTIEEFFKKRYKTLIPFEHDGSLNLIQAIKDGDRDNVAKKIFENKFLVHDFDHFHQTALHWAAKRNRFTIIPMLIRKGASVNAEDINGRTPLHLASERNNLESIKILLYEMADPFKKNHSGKMAIELTQNKAAHFYLNSARILHIIHAMGNAKKFHQRVKNGFDFLFNEVEQKDFIK